MAKVGMVSPWVKFYRQVEAFFKYDDEVNVVYYEDDNVLKIFVDNDTKAYALQALLPEGVVYGNVVMDVVIVPANNNNINDIVIDNINDISNIDIKVSLINLFRTALSSNRAVSDIVTIDNISSNSFTYIIFEPIIAQYYTDDLSDAHGLCSTLYQDIAKEIFKKRSGIYFCTDIAIDNIDDDYYISCLR